MLDTDKLALFGGTPITQYEPVAWPYSDDNEVKEVERVLRSGIWQSGDEVRKFEESFSRYQQAQYGLCITNGTATLEILLRACGVKSGDEVILPASTFVACGLAILMTGAKPVFVDCSEDLNIAVDRVAEAVTEKTRAIMPVHINGNPADMPGLLTIARKFGLKVIEDCAHAHGSELGSRRLGTFGDGGSFSFQTDKCISCGDGGFITTNDPDLYENCLQQRMFGLHNLDAFSEKNIPGSNFRMTEMQAAILNVQLSRLDGQIEERQKSADMLDDALKNSRAFSSIALSKDCSRWSGYGYKIRINREYFGDIPKELILKALRTEGVNFGSCYYPMYRNPVFRVGEKEEYLNRMKALCPNSEKAYESEIIGISHQTLLKGGGYIKNALEALFKLERNLDPLMQSPDR